MVNEEYITAVYSGVSTQGIAILSALTILCRH